ncbi:MAG: M1 family metallopeptidase [Saprospiraceae bacterium]|nr:M1 family metallopeptidase [Saprospiraceae bacterium]
MNWKSWTYLSLITLSFSACYPKAALYKPAIEERMLDTVSVTADRVDPNETKDTSIYEPPIYRSSYKRTNDLLHTKLDVRFDWSKQYLIGKATLTLKPLFYTTDKLRLDAKGFDLKKVALLDAEGKLKPLKHVYRTKLVQEKEVPYEIHIQLDKKYTAKEEYKIYIEYVAKPNELPLGGSNAITADKGLYFINPLGDDPYKPQQIWTQGETESSSCWFPTIDRPNERCTQEIAITVKDKFRTLSNGVLEKSQKNTDGSRTDYWLMDKPHTPYLFMMAIGEFATVKDSWNGIELEYIVEKEFEKDAKAIYPYTPEMLTFFSEKLGYKYPWQKYSQVIVRDYVSGAMENTTGVIFGEFMQMDSRALLDNGDLNEAIVAHEMMHHWFGDLVTCESWSNLPLNESFANYSEYLWFEHKHGKDAADYIRKNEMSGYITQAVLYGDQHPLIHFQYDDKEDMFDQHSYNKGGTILHMLRNHIGDEAFFEALKVYLKEHEYTAVEAHDLRLAFEKVTGEDLNWFFNQWFFRAGHPDLTIRTSYDKNKQEVVVNIIQEQAKDKNTTFILPIDIDIHTSSKAQRERVWMDQPKQTFRFKSELPPSWIAVDADRILLAERNYELNKDERVSQYLYGTNYMDRSEALKGLQYQQKGNPEVKKVFTKALKDPFWNIRVIAVDNIMVDEEADIAIIRIIKDLAKNDPRAHVRAAAMDKLGMLNDPKYMEIPKIAIGKKEPSYLVLASALGALISLDKSLATAQQYAKTLENENSTTLRMLIADIYSQGADKSFASFFDTQWKKTDNYASFRFFKLYSNLLINIQDDKFTMEKLEAFKAIALDNQPKTLTWWRYGASNAIYLLYKHSFDQNKKAMEEWTVNTLKEIRSTETDPDLQKLYKKWKLPK